MRVSYSVTRNRSLDAEDLLIGLSGIALARFYLDIHPDKQVVLIEKEDAIGGTWRRCKGRFASLQLPLICKSENI